MCVYYMHLHPLLDPSLRNQLQHIVVCSYEVVLVILHPDEEGQKLMTATIVTVLHISVTASVDC